MWCSRPARSRHVARVGEVVRLLVRREPDARLGAVVEHDLLGQPEAEVVLAEHARLAGVDREEVDVIEVADADAAPRVAARLVLERGPQLRRSRVVLGLVEELDAVAVGVEEAVGAAMAEVAVDPVAGDASGIERCDPAGERLRAVRAIREVTDARLRRRGELERGALVVAEAAQVDRVALLAGDLHAEDLAEVEEALVRLRREQLDVREVSEVADRFGHVRYPCGSSSRCPASRLASAMIVSDGLTESVCGTSEPSPT